MSLTSESCVNRTLQQRTATGTSEMRICPLGRNTATCRPCNESLLQEIGLIDVADGVGLLSHRCGQGLDPDWTTIELIDYRGSSKPR